MSARTYFLHALTPLHPGSGQGHGLIDLPVARDVSTNHPVLYGSSLKGVLRDAARDDYPRREEEEGKGKRDPKVINDLFGKEKSENMDVASPIRLTDARLLLLPVRSDKGTFAWVTCPLALQRFVRESAERFPNVPDPGDGAMLSPGNIVASRQGPGERVVLAELPLPVRGAPGNWGTLLAARIFPDEPVWREMLEKRFVLVSDDTFTWLAETATEVRAQIRVNPDTGTVDKGALWYSEVLPAESILSGTCEVIPHGTYKPEDGWKLLRKIARKNIQVGGKASIGLGQVRVVFSGEDQA